MELSINQNWDAKADIHITHSTKILHMSTRSIVLTHSRHVKFVPADAISLCSCPWTIFESSFHDHEVSSMVYVAALWHIRVAEDCIVCYPSEQWNNLWLSLFWWPSLSHCYTELKWRLSLHCIMNQARMCLIFCLLELSETNKNVGGSWFRLIPTTVPELRLS